MYPKNRFVKLNERKYLVKDFFRLSMGLTVLTSSIVHVVKEIALLSETLFGSLC